MKKVKTVYLYDDNLKKLRALQAKSIEKTIKHVSFSKIINQVLEKGLEKGLQYD